MSEQYYVPSVKSCLFLCCENVKCVGIFYSENNRCFHRTCAKNCGDNLASISKRNKITSPQNDGDNDQEMQQQQDLDGFFHEIDLLPEETNHSIIHFNFCDSVTIGIKFRKTEKNTMKT